MAVATAYTPYGVALGLRRTTIVVRSYTESYLREGQKEGGVDGTQDEMEDYLSTHGYIDWLKCPPRVVLVPPMPSRDHLCNRDSSFGHSGKDAIGTNMSSMPDGKIKAEAEALGGSRQVLTRRRAQPKQREGSLDPSNSLLLNILQTERT